MTEKLKYKVGDKLLVEMEVVSVDSTNRPYQLETSGGCYIGWLSKENLEKSVVNLPPRPKVTPTVMEYYEKNEHNNWDIVDWLDSNKIPADVDKWLFEGEEILQHQHALATLIAYGPEAVEVKKEKKYKVKFKPTNQWLRRAFGLYSFVKEESDSFTKQELIDSGFEGVFDNEVFEIEEVV